MLLAARGSPSTNVFPITIGSNQGSPYNLRTAALAAGLGASEVALVVVTVNTGVSVQAGFLTGSGWPTGTVLRLVNNGTIAGLGGAGGNGGNATGTTGSAGLAGDAGGDAITLSYPMTIDNTNGFIYAGGGGGGAGPGASNGAGGGAGGGPGGGGQGYNNAAAGAIGTGSNGGFPAFNSTAGTAGSFAAFGLGGNGYDGGTFRGGDGGRGGSWGGSGVQGQPGSGASVGTIRFGGAGGKAVDLNGHAVTWAGGNNGTQVKGAVS